MGKISTSITAITVNKNKSNKMNFCINGKVSQTDRIDNIQVNSDLTNEKYVFGLSENFVYKVEENSSVISMMNEIKKYQKKAIDESFENFSSGFSNCVTSTYDYIFSVSGDEQDSFEQGKFFTSLVIGDNQIKFIGTDHSSSYYISNNEVEDVFNNDETKEEEIEALDYIPPSNKLKTINYSSLNVNDVIVLTSSKASSVLSTDDLDNLINSVDSSEDITWKIMNFINEKNITDEIVIMVIKIMDIDGVANPKAVVPPIIIKEDEEEKTEEVTNEEDVKEDVSSLSPTFNGNIGLKFDEQSTNKKKGKNSKRMNIYLKKILAIVITLALLAGIVYAMVQLVQLIYNNDDGGDVTVTTSSVSIPKITTKASTTKATTAASTTATTVATEPKPTTTPYTVQPGDTLYYIITLYYGSYSEEYAMAVAAINEMDDPNALYVGQILQMPFFDTEAENTAAN